MTGSVELEIPWGQLGQFPNQTPQGQNFTPDQLGVTETPLAVVDRAGLQGQNAIRAKIAELMNDETLLCPIADFLEHYGPVTFESKENAKAFTKDIAKCKKYLVDEGLLKQLPDKKTFRWRDFHVNPAQYANSEKRVFDDLVPIMNAIDEYALKKGFMARGNDYKFVCVADTNLHGDIPGTTHRIDGGTMDSEYKEGKLPVRFIMAPHEYKKERNADDQRTVRQQAVGAAHHILCDDVRRMFIFSVTIEDSRMSLWYFSRSHSVKALSFDWCQEDIDTFIHVFLKFAYATPEELGIDPTVHLAPRDPTAKLVGATAPAQHYIYQHEVPQDEDPAKRARRAKTPPVFKFFKTVQAINDMRPYNLSGRNTRIWSVVEVTGPNSNEEVTGERLILKDVWLDTSRNTEAENMDLIFEAIGKLVDKSKAECRQGDWQAHLMANDPRFSELDDQTKARLQHFLTDGNYRSLFLTKLYAWKGATSKELCAKALHSPKGVDIFPEEGVTLQAGTDERTGTQVGQPVQTGNTSNAPPKGNETEEEVNDRKKQAFERKTRRNFLPKRQSRFVYKEVCQDLDTLGTLGNAMDVLNQALDALRILFCANWVHRDISAKNILAFNDNGVWKVKLADLEFSEELGSNVKRTDPRTGTPYYMPYEVMARHYLLDQARARLPPKRNMATGLKLTEGTPEYERYKTFREFDTRAEAVPPTATSDIPSPGDVVQYNYQHDLEAIWWIVLYFITALVNHRDSRSYSDTVFKSKIKLDQGRIEAFTMDFVVHVSKKLHPTLAGPFEGFMEKLRSSMIEEYMTRELFGQLEVHESYAYIHALFATQFRQLLEKNEGNWKAMPIAPKRQLVYGSKRPLEQDHGHLEEVRTATDPNKRPRTRASRR